MTQSLPISPGPNAKFVGVKERPPAPCAPRESTTAREPERGVLLPGRGLAVRLPPSGLALRYILFDVSPFLSLYTVSAAFIVVYK